MHDVTALTPIANNHLFKPSQLDQGFTAWKNKGLMWKFAFFGQLQSVFNIR